MSRKIIIDSDKGREVFDLIGTSTTVGRADDCDLVLQDDRVSRHHCRFVHVDDELLVEDLGSGNGTIVDGERIDGRRVLLPGARVEVGGQILFADRAPFRTANAGAAAAEEPFVVAAPPASRRQAGDRKARTNAIPIVVGFAALILVIFVVNVSLDRKDEAEARKTRENAAGVAASTGDKKEARDDEAARRIPSDLGTEERQRLEARARALEDLDFGVQQALIQNDYATAFRVLADFEARHGKAGPAIPRRIEAAMTKASGEAIGTYQRLIGEGRADLALAALEDMRARFPEGSPARGDIERILARPMSEFATVTSGGAQAATTAHAEVPAVPVRAPISARPAGDEAAREEARNHYFALADEAEILLGQRRYQDAATRFRAAGEAGARAGLEPGLMAPVLRKMRQAERLRDFVLAVEDAARNRGEVFGKVPFLSDRRGEVKGVSDEGIVFEDELGEVVISPRVLRSDAMKTMVQKLDFDAIGRVNAATFLLTVGERELAEKLLHRSESETAGLKPEIDSILADAFAIDLPEGGFVWHDGHYLSPNDVTRVKVREAIDENTPKLQNGDAAKRQEAYAALRALGDRAASAYQRALLDAKVVLLQRAEAMGGVKKLAQLDARRQELETARESALELIFDEQKYPYPYRGVGQEIYQMYLETQKEIDLRTKVVADLWADTSSVKLTPELREVVAMLAEYNRELDRLELGRGPADPRHLLHLPASVAVDLRNYAWSDEERVRIDVSATWMAENETQESKATAAEREQVRITNDYRVMMGRHAVKLNEKLLATARMHSEDMAKGGFFAHENPLDPKKRSPMDRAQLNGFNGVGLSENIAKNPGGPMGAHKAWLHSSGHHRNILTAAWRVLGSGNAGSLWTQNFSIREYGDAESSRGIKGGDATPRGAPPAEDENQ